MALNSSCVFFFPAILLAVVPGLWGEQFVYKHTAGDKHRILSVVSEDVYVNRRLTLRSEILNRVAVEALEADAGMGRLRAVFRTAERAVRDIGGQSSNFIAPQPG